MITVGLINLSQIGIGLMFFIGMLTISSGFSIGIIAHGGYVYAGIIAITLFKINRCIAGAHSQFSIIKKQSVFRL